MSEFSPPIKTRSTDELLTIVGNPEGWNPKAIKLAKEELYSRKIPQKKITTAMYLAKKRQKLEIKILANKGYSIFDFLFRPFATTFMLLFSWEFKKDGLLKKARQQKYFRLVVLLIILIYVIYIYIKNQVLE